MPTPSDLLHIFRRRKYLALPSRFVSFRVCGSFWTVDKRFAEIRKNDRNELTVRCICHGVAMYYGSLGAPTTIGHSQRSIIYFHQLTYELRTHSSFGKHGTAFADYYFIENWCSHSQKSSAIFSSIFIRAIVLCDNKSISRHPGFERYACVLTACYRK